MVHVIGDCLLGAISCLRFAMGVDGGGGGGIRVRPNHSYEDVRSNGIGVIRVCGGINFPEISVT